MKLGARILLGYATVAVTAAAMSYWSFAATRDARRSAATVTRATVPSLEALDEVRLGGLRVVASVTEFALLHAEARLGEVAADTVREDEDEERRLISEGCEEMEWALTRYELLVWRHDASDLALAREIGGRAADLRDAGRAVEALTESDVTGEPVLAAKARFERQEQAFLMAVGRAKNHETAEVRASSAALVAAGHRSLVAVALTGAATILLALILGFSIAQPLTASLRRLTEGSRAIGAGNLATRIVVPARDETAELATAFNDMARQLECSGAEMQAARVAAETASRAKSDFLAHMSHEIRTPLNGILGLTQLTLETELAPEPRQHLALVQASGEILLRVINDVLDFSRIEAGHLELQQAPFAPAACVRRALGTLSPLARQRGLLLTTRLDPRLPETLVGDAGRLEQVLYNLVGNALKFTDHGGVTVEAGLADEPAGPAVPAAVTLAFRVQDTGSGIPEAQQEAIFASFVQVDGTLTRRQGGTGLGLAITRRLVEAMGGRIGVISQSGRGSTFHFTVRAMLPTADTANASPRRPSATPSSLPATSPPTPPLRLLVAEDNAVNQVLVRRLLERQGHTVHLVGDGAAALAAWSAGTFDAVLMDIQMPEMDGYEATRRIRAAEAGAAGPGRTPILALTAHALESERARAVEAGMDAYLTKPIDVQALAAALAQVATGAGAAAGEPLPA
ncbi:MAG: hybrid sensor histidine kinase/response regulator [Candidatus Krumholzibacteriia bacterium]